MHGVFDIRRTFELTTTSHAGIDNIRQVSAWWQTSRQGGLTIQIRETVSLSLVSQPFNFCHERDFAPVHHYPAAE